MLRASLLLLLASALAASSVFLAWGEKSVAYEECRLDVERAARVCRVQEVRAFYDPDALRGRVASLELVDGEAGEVEAGSFWRPYDEPTPGRAGAGTGAPSGPDAWWRSPVLPWARPLLVASSVVAPASVAVGWTLGRREGWTRRASWAPLASAALSGAAFLASLGGVALHALTWTASRVEPLRALPGTWVLVAAGLAGVAGGLRMHVVLRDRAEGRTGASPLVPAQTLYGFDADTDAEPEPAPPRDGTVLRWPAGGGLAVAAVVLLLLPLGVPLATKDITLRDCVEDPARGAVCSEEPLSVTYHAAHAEVLRVRDPASVSELLAVGGPHYFGAFQDAHGGPAWMGSGAVVAVPGGVGLLAWLAASAAGRATGRLRDVSASLLAGGFLLSVLGIAAQASAWVGAPAHPSRPAVGLFAGVAGLLALAAWEARLWRERQAARRAVRQAARQAARDEDPSGTATTTSGAG